VIGFGGRVIGAGEPKYLNSPETPLFEKGRELYGLYQARRAIRDANRVIVVEGYMDVVALAQHGVDYAVATLGTSTTPVHAQKLFRQTDSVVFCFDGDAAGRKAAWRALENALPVLQDGKDARFLFLPDGEDPDDFVRARGKAAFEAAVAGAMPLSEYLVAELTVRHPPGTAEGRAALLAAARPLLAQIDAPILAALLRRRLGILAGLPDGEIATLLGGERPSRPAPAGPQGGERPRSRAARLPVRRAPSLARELLQGILLQPALARSLELPPVPDPSADAAALSAVVSLCGTAAGELTAAGIVQFFIGTPHEAAVADALATAEDQALTPDLAEERVKAGMARYWQQAERAGTARAPLDVASTPEERERMRQLDFVRGVDGAAGSIAQNGVETR